LSDISSFTQTLFPTPNGLVFVMDEQGRLIGLPRESDLLDVRLGRGDMLRPLADFQAPALKAPFAAWRGRRVGDDRAPRNFAFQDHGRTMWAGWRAFPLSPETGLWIGVVVPESDLLGELERQKRTIIAITLVTLVLAALASVWLARFYSLPLRRLVGESERIRRLDLRGRGRVVSRLREVRQLAEAQESMRAALASFARYLPTDVVRELLARGEAAQIGGRVETLTVMFTDIVGFTRIAEGLSAPALAHHLSDYFECLLEALQRHQATIDKLVGDGVMAFWGAPRPDPRHARHAVEGALGCLEALAGFNRRCREREMPDLPTRIALAVGEAVVGNIGAPSRLNYTALGDTVNLASRLVKANDLYGTTVLVARPVREAAGDAFAWRLLDRIMVRGKREAVEIFEPLGPAGQVDRGRLLLAEQYEAALRAFWRRDFGRAVRGLEDIGATGGKDRSVVRLLALARGYLTHPPPENWDGTARREDG
jgi:adenylate cyclase